MEKSIVCCPSCKSNIYLDIYPQENIVQCSGCMLVYSYLRGTISELKKYYSEKYFDDAKKKSYTNVGAPHEAVATLLENGDMSWFEKQAYQQLPWILEASGKSAEALQGKYFLEIGTGWGCMMLASRLLGMNPTGYEFAKPNCELGKRMGLDIRNENFCDVPVEQDKYSFIYLSHSFEHVADPKKCLENLYKSCAKGGSIFISVPNFLSFWHEKTKECWPWLSPLVHLTHFTKNSLQTIVENAGFITVKCETSMTMEPSFENYALVKEELEEKDDASIVKRLKQLEQEDRGESVWLFALK